MTRNSSDRPRATGSDPSSPSLQQRVETLLKDITPGEWQVAPCSDTDETRDVVADYTEREEPGLTVKQAHWIAELSGDFDFGVDEEAEFQKLEANAQFIAAAPQLVRDLWAEVARLQGEREQLLLAIDPRQALKGDVGATVSLAKAHWQDSEDVDMYEAQLTTLRDLLREVEGEMWETVQNANTVGSTRVRHWAKRIREALT